MSPVAPLAAAINALAPEAYPVFDGDATGASFPRVVLTHRLPGVVARGESGDPHALGGQVQVTFSAATAAGVRTMWDVIFPAFEGARVAADGWLTTPLRMVEDNVRTYVDRDVTVPVANVYPVVGVVTFAYTVAATN